MMKVTSKGQVTIPQEIREKYGFLPDTEIQFREHRGRVVIEKSNHTETRGTRLIERMRGSSDVKMTTDQIMELTRGR